MSRVIDHVRHLAATDPARMALSAPEQKLGYGALWQAVQALGVTLEAAGERTIAMDIANPVNWMIADLALVLKGNVTVPLPPFFSAAQKRHALHSAGAGWVLTDVPEIAAAAGKQVVACARELFLCPVPASEVVHHHGTARITYTSGTTGEPKGVCLSQSAMETVADSLLATLGDTVATHYGGLMPLAVLLENIGGFYTAMLAGGCYHVPPAKATGNFVAMAAFLADEQISSCILVPELLSGLVQAFGQLPHPLPHMRYMAVGGARISPTLLEQARALGLPVYQGYGLSESASVSCINIPGANRPGTVGRPLPHIRLRLADDGEIILQDPLFLGYTGAPPAPRLYPTGDLGHVDIDGFVTISGRKKNVLILSSGRNISPEWPESRLLAEAGIMQALVIGEARPCLGALIVSSGEDTAVEQALARANQPLPEYARIKHWRRVEPFSTVNGLLTGTGRPKRAAIIRQHHSLIETMYHQEETVMEPFFNRLENETREEREALVRIPLLQDAVEGNITLDTYLAFLEQAYHHVKHTTPLLMACGSRLPASREWLRDAIAEYIEEELGHQEWILGDIDKSGGDAERVRHGTPNMATELMVAYAYDSVMRGNPASFFGMVYVLEGTSIKLATACAGAIGTALNLSENCFSYLLSHGSLDIRHMDFFEKLMNRLDDPQDQQAIIHMAKCMFRLYGDVFRSIPHPQVTSHAA